MANCECLLILQKGDTLRVIPECERVGVKLGSETCKHFIGTPKIIYRDPPPPDVTHTCRRSQAARTLPPIDKRVIR